MGFNFIHSQAKAHTKAWSDRFTRSANNLFANPINPTERAFIAKGAGYASAKEGDRVHVRRLESDIVVYQGLSPIAAAQAPSLALFEMVDLGHGVIEGQISQVIQEAGLLIVKVVEGPSK